jgi:hypothetical protein
MMPDELLREDFEQIVAEHGHLVRLMNELEYRLYALNELPPSEPVTACQQAAGALLGALRSFLFRQDQQVLPFLEGRVKAAR